MNFTKYKVQLLSYKLRNIKGIVVSNAIKYKEISVENYQSFETSKFNNFRKLLDSILKFKME